MNRFWFAAALFAAALFAVTGASAQSGVAFNGPYLGLNFGGGTVNDDGLHTCQNSAGNALTCAVQQQTHTSIHGSGIIGGAQAGYNFALLPFGVPTVIGLEADIQGTNITGSSTTNYGGAPLLGGGTAASTNFNDSQSLAWLSTARVRLGYAGINRLLLFVTAGLGAAESDQQFTQNTATVTASGSQAKIKFGPVAGGGVEYMITDRLSLKGEGLWYDFGNNTVQSPTFVTSTGAPTGLQAGRQFQTSGAIFRVGLNWQFGAAPAPAPVTPVAAPAPARAPAPAPVAAERKFIVYFDFDKASLTADGQKVINSAIAYYKQGGVAKVQLAGHADRAGSDAYNLKLSQRRADTVSAALVKGGVAKTAITSRAFGESAPRVPTPDGVREPQNRRVEISE